jgi:DNA (cytosine-5)-methyltransferase 1
MKWEKPAPTITTKFVSVSNGRFAHPEENRGISIREGATLQTFPTDYTFHCGSITTAARIIGNAVPPRFAKSLGETMVQAHNNIRHKT